MANLLSVAELTWRSIYPEPRERTAITLEEFVATAKMEYATAMWLYRQEQIALEGWFDFTSGLLTEAEIEVVEGVADISSLKFLSVLPGEIWLQNVGGACECRYIKTTMNLHQLLCDDDSLSETDYLYYVQGKKIKFPKGTHKKTLPIVYANTGIDLDAEGIEVDDYVASKVRTKLLQLYGGRVPEDVTNNQNPNL